MLLLIGAAVVWRGSDRAPADPCGPLEVVGARHPSVAMRPTLRVATFNIHGGKGRDGVCDLGRTAACLEDVDFAGLNEVHGSWRGAASSQAADLGRRLGMRGVFAATERRWWHDHFGNGVLSRLPLTGCHRIPLPGTQAKKYRNAILANVVHGGRTVHVLVVHIDRVRDREVQLQAVVDLFLSLAEPAVLMGDLNTRPGDPQIERLLGTPGVSSALAEGLGESAPHDNIDWIFTRGLLCLDAEYGLNDASDHPYVVAELELQPQVDAQSRLAGGVERPGP